MTLLPGVHSVPAEARAPLQAGENRGERGEDGAGQEELPAGQGRLRQGQQAPAPRAAPVLREEGGLLPAQPPGAVAATVGPSGIEAPSHLSCAGVDQGPGGLLRGVHPPLHPPLRRPPGHSLR